MNAQKVRSELETILGIVTYLTLFAPDLATLTAPLRNLLRKAVEFVWDGLHDETLQNKRALGHWIAHLSPWPGT